MLAEVEDKKNKVSKDDAPKFIATMLLAQRHFKLKDTMALYICTGGFSKPAQQILQDNSVTYSALESILS